MEANGFVTGRNALRIFAVLFVALALFLRFRPHRPAPPRPTSVRGPLKIVLPPFTADKVEILAELRERKFQELDAEITGYQKQFEKDVMQEANVALAFGAFASADPEVGKLVDEWAKASPNSFVAQYAHARWLFKAGWRARGTKVANETSDEQFRRMGELFKQAAQATAPAIKLNPKLTVAYAQLADAAKTADDKGALFRAVAGAGLRQVPESFAIRSTIMDALRPRWGGSYEAMARFSDQSQKLVQRNPRLVAFKGYVAWDQGTVAAGERHYAEAIGFYNTAIAQGGDDYRFYSDRGDAYYRLGLYADALEDLSRSIRLQPQNPPTIENLAAVQAQLLHPQDAQGYIELYRRLTPPDSFLVGLENWTQGRLGGTQRAAAAGGD